jgi:hypothetical protein
MDFLTGYSIAVNLDMLATGSCTLKPSHCERGSARYSGLTDAMDTCCSYLRFLAHGLNSVDVKDD